MELNIQVWPIERLKPYDQNVKVHDKKQVEKIAASIREFGWTQPIVVDKEGMIIAGHGRRLAAIELKMARVPVAVRDDLSPEQVRALRLADNRVAEGSIDTELFRKELASLDFDMTSFFDPKEIDFSLADLGLVNTDSFIDDVSSAVDQQELASREAASAVKTEPVMLKKLLGFDKVPGEAQLAVSRFMAHVELTTGLKGAEAFVQFAKGVA